MHGNLYENHQVNFTRHQRALSKSTHLAKQRRKGADSRIRNIMRANPAAHLHVGRSQGAARLADVMISDFCDLRTA